MAQGTRPGGGDSFLAYLVGQRAKQGHGVKAIDKAAGIDKLKMPASNTGTGASTQSAVPAQAAAPAAAPAPQAPQQPGRPIEPGLYEDRSNIVRTQPVLQQNLEVDRFFKLTGKLPTAAELSVQQFSKRFREQQGRSPTRNEIMAQLFRMPELLRDPASEFEVVR